MAELNVLSEKASAGEGIKERESTFYGLLKVEPTATSDDLFASYTKLMLVNHPDQATPENRKAAVALCDGLEEAFEVLSNPESRALYDSKYISKAKTERFLVLIDLNGTLVIRTKGTCAAPGHTPIYSRKVKGGEFQFVYPRKYLKQAIARLTSNPKISLAVYTSIQEQNAIPIVEAAIGKNWRQTLFALYAGDAYCSPDIASGKEWETKRALPKIWAHRTCTARGVQFDATNTVMVDNEAPKVVDCRANAILIEEATLAGVGHDSGLIALAEYIEALAANCKIDVRKYLEANPLGSAASTKFSAKGAADDLTAALEGMRLVRP